MKDTVKTIRQFIFIYFENKNIDYHRCRGEIFNKFKSTLTQKGLAEMKSLGEHFNADIHEAITSIPAPSEEMKGKVVDELEKGYNLNGKIIRFAKVVTGS